VEVLAIVAVGVVVGFTIGLVIVGVAARIGGPLDEDPPTGVLPISVHRDYER
jgi:hypothetical protein